MNDDLISRQAAIDAIRASTSKYTGFMEMEMYTDDDAVEAIEGVPSVEPEIVRCKDCKWWDNEDDAERCTHKYCSMWAKPDGYCSYGERANA